MIKRNQDDPRYEIDHKRKVFVYKNLHQDCWSIRQDGLVKAHTTEVNLWDCTFQVNAKGRQKVLDEQRKNVHAGIKGYLQHICHLDTNGKEVEVTYNPYKYETFVDKKDESFVYYADQVLLQHNQVTAYIS